MAVASPRVRRLLVGFAIAVGVLIAVGLVLYATAPAVGDAEQRVRAILRAHDGRDTGLPLPTRVAAATVAVEDERFYDHGAVDPVSIGRALWSTLTDSDTDPGGSTITQQLAKVLYLHYSGSFTSRIRAIVLATKLELHYSKREILEMYLNAIYYGHRYWGIGEASLGYFHVAPDRLTWGQASLLAGLPQAPSAYDPFEHYPLARRRQREVLAQLVDTGALSNAAAAAAFRATPRPHQASAAR